MFSWFCGHDLAIEQPVRLQIFPWKAHFDRHLLAEILRQIDELQHPSLPLYP
jgi:hypothetical protein